MLKRLAVLLSLALVTAVPAAADSATLNIDAGLLTDSNGNPLANGDLILVIASQNGVFTPTVGNQFVSGNNFILSSGTSSTGSVTGAFGMNTALTGVAGETDNSIQFDLNEGATGTSASTIFSTGTSSIVGDKLAIRWYSNYTLAQFEAGVPVTGNYGTYTDTELLSAGDDGGAAWVVPAGGSAVDLDFFTFSDVNPTPGDQPNALGQALTPTGSISVPEPSTYALLATGLLFVAGVAVRKKRPAIVTK